MAGHIHRRLRVPIAAVFAGVLAAPCTAAEIYKWVDDNGKVHFSDRAPGAGAETVNIHTAPGRGTPQPVPDPGERRERRRRLLDAYAEERARKKELAEKQAAEAELLEQRCARARRELDRMRAASYLYDEDEQGNRNIYSDAERRKATEKLEKQIKQSCG